MSPKDEKGQGPVAMASLETLYRATTYRVCLPEGVVDIRVDEPNPELERFLEQGAIRSWVFVSAVNPASRLLSAGENAARHGALCRAIRESCRISYHGEGIPDEGAWPAEPGLWVAGLDEEAARKLGARFGQNAVVWGGRGEAPRLLWCMESARTA